MKWIKRIERLAHMFGMNFEYLRPEQAAIIGNYIVTPNRGFEFDLWDMHEEIFILYRVPFYRVERRLHYLLT